MAEVPGEQWVQMRSSSSDPETPTKLISKLFRNQHCLLYHAPAHQQLYCDQSRTPPAPSTRGPQHPAHRDWAQDYLQDLNIRQVVRANLTSIHLDVL